MTEVHCAHGASSVTGRGQGQHLALQMVHALTRHTRLSLVLQPLVQTPHVYLTAIIACRAHLMHVIESEFDEPHRPCWIVQRYEGHHGIFSCEDVAIRRRPARHLQFVRGLGQQQVAPPLDAIHVVRVHLVARVAREVRHDTLERHTARCIVRARVSDGLLNGWGVQRPDLECVVHAPRDESLS